MKLSEIKPDLATQMLIKGEPGTGKTPAALSFPVPILYFDCDYRARAVVQFFRNDKERLSQIEVIQPKHFDEVKKKLDEVLALRNPKFKTLVLDPLTTFADTAIRSAMATKSSGGAGRKIGTINLPGIQDYGDEAGILTEVITMMRLIYMERHINTILVAHVITTEEKELSGSGTKISYSRSLLTGGKKVGAKIPSYFDEVHHFTVRPGFDGKPEFVSILRHTGFDFARTGLAIDESEVNFTNHEGNPEKFYYQLLKKYFVPEEEYKKRIEEEDKVDRQIVIKIDQ